MKTGTYVKVVGDHNDGDYSTVFEKVDAKDVAILKKVAVALSQFKSYKSKTIGPDSMEWTHRHNWPDGECLREDLGEWNPKKIYVDSGKLDEETYEIFSERFVPWNEGRIHTIVSIELIEVTSTDMLFERF